MARSLHDDEASLDLLKEEYFFLQRIYEDFDKRLLGIKRWAVTVCIAGIGLGFEYKGSARWIWFLVAAASLGFWFIEALWKQFQYGHTYRIRELEGFFRRESEIESIHPLQIYHSWFQKYAHDKPLYQYEEKRPRLKPAQRLLRDAIRPMVLMPYAVILLFAAFLIVINPAVNEKAEPTKQTQALEPAKKTQAFELAKTQPQEPAKKTQAQEPAKKTQAH